MQQKRPLYNVQPHLATVWTPPSGKIGGRPGQGTEGSFLAIGVTAKILSLVHRNIDMHRSRLSICFRRAPTTDRLEQHLTVYEKRRNHHLGNLVQFVAIRERLRGSFLEICDAAPGYWNLVDRANTVSDLTARRHPGQSSVVCLAMRIMTCIRHGCRFFHVQPCFACRLGTD